MNTPLTFIRSKAGAHDFLCVAGVPDETEPFTPFCRVCRYDGADPGPVKWFYDDLPIWVTSVTRFSPSPGVPSSFCLLSAEGDVVLLRPPFPREKIPGAGISSPDSRMWGRMAHLHRIGDRLYACGDGGQIYRRAAGDFGAGRWEHLDPSLLQDPAVRADALLNTPDSPDARMKVYYRVNGPSEDDIYVTGAHGTMLWWDGRSIVELPKVTDAALTEILVKSSQEIFVCGRNGTFLRGNRSDGFLLVASAERQMFTSMALFDGKVYLASGANPRGLFVYDRGAIHRVWSGLHPDIADVHTVDSVEGALWAVGSKDVLRFDGARWERIDHVDNPPIR